MTRFIETNGLHMHIIEEGTGPLVVLLHGFPELSITWHHQIRALAAAGYRVVAPDQRGYGKTDSPDREDAYTLLHLVGDVIGLLDALGEPHAVIIGHDWGAPVAWTAAQLRPDRVRAVAGLSVAPRPRSSVRPSDGLQRVFGDSYYQLYFQKPGVAERDFSADVRGGMRRLMYAASGDVPAEQRWTGFVTGEFFHGIPDPGATPAWLGDAQLDALAAEFTRTGFRGGLSWYRNLDRNWELLAPFAGLPIRQPSLFVIGDRDPSYVNAKPAIEAFPLTLPGLRGKLIIEGGGHWIGEERPEQVNAALLEFLAGL
jgi:pimeloyl-ACP methyl ester carboxylesterase